MLPEPSLRRLPWYLAHLKLMHDRGVEFVSSTLLARVTNVDPSRVAKDLSHIGISGKTRVGYEVALLVEVLEEVLGFNRMHKACIFGVGRLGRALLHDSGLEEYGVEIVAGFDTRVEIIGEHINNIPIFSTAQLGDYMKHNHVDIGILTVPVERAQSAADYIVAGGIKAIWNFTPYRIKVAKSIVVQNTSIYSHLAVMFNRLHEINNKV